MNKDKVLKLAKLARIELSDEESQRLVGEFEAILNYVGQVKGTQKANSSKLTADSFSIKNVMREDAKPHESGIHTEELLKQAPNREGDYIKVKKIL